jgi:hypothetical protein
MNTKAQSVKLVNGEFTPVQASDIITSLIKQKINFHKIEGLQNWMRNHDTDSQPINSRIEELQNAEEEAKAFIIDMKKKGMKIKIIGNLEISAVEE